MMVQQRPDRQQLVEDANLVLSSDKSFVDEKMLGKNAAYENHEKHYAMVYGM